MRKNQLVFGLIFSGIIAIVIISCVKDPAAKKVVNPLPVAPPVSFVEEFTNVGDLASKGWVLRNLSSPVGQTGWRQGRYESGATSQYKFAGPVPYIGFPGYSISKSPQDFISCDVSAVNEGKLSAWLISPVLPIKEGDQIVFFTRAADDSNYPVYTKDRMQVRANFSDGTVNLTDTGVGNFSKLLLDINPRYIYNDPSGGQGSDGYPRAWRKYTINIDTVPGNSAAAARFAFRYYGNDAGLQGGSAGSNYATIVGIDSLAFIRK